MDDRVDAVLPGSAVEAVDTTEYDKTAPKEYENLENKKNKKKLMEEEKKKMMAQVR